MLLQTRKNLAYFVKKLGVEKVNAVPEGFSNNIIWNFGHCIATQQLILYKRAGLEMNVPDWMIEEFKRGTKPARIYDEKAVGELLQFSKDTTRQFGEDWAAKKFKNYEPWTTLFGAPLNTIEDAATFNLIHENMHLGYIMALKKALR